MYELAKYKGDYIAKMFVCLLEEYGFLCNERANRSERQTAKPRENQVNFPLKIQRERRGFFSFSSKMRPKY